MRFFVRGEQVGAEGGDEGDPPCHGQPPVKEATVEPFSGPYDTFLRVPVQTVGGRHKVGSRSYRGNVGEV
jgi:hypothetical protein